ncbi:MAG: DUF6789 family protein [Promethearchaeati archaeon SRVP18_Atabeyarchaeia-1]
MADYVLGIKAGILAGTVYAVVFGFTLIAFGTTLLGKLGEALGLIDQANVIIVGVTGGMLWGLGYADLYDNLPTESSIPKGIVMGLVFWLVFSVALGYGYLSYAEGVAYFALEFVFQVLVFGVLLGLFWSVFGEEKK